MMHNITSRHNRIIKEVNSLKEKKHREQKNLFFIEGIRIIEEAVKENIEIAKVLISDRIIGNKGFQEILQEIEAKKYETYLLPDKLFKEISDTENPQGILAVARLNRYSLDEFTGKSDFLIILESIQDPGNLGTIIRTADAAGVTGVILSNGCVDIYNPKVLRSTMGSIFHVPVCFSDDLPETIKMLKSKDIKVVAAHLKGELSCFELDISNNIAIVIGNEAGGISNEVASCCDALVNIPMAGRAESLNASVAAGLLMYEVLRRKINIF